jgi:hypothetical protein
MFASALSFRSCHTDHEAIIAVIGAQRPPFEEEWRRGALADQAA